MNLALEIEYLSGVSFAAIGPESRKPDWPPQPDRVFSALVASWAARGKNNEERQALEWLERLAPPRVFASHAEPRTGVTVFVPPNDPRSDKQKHAAGVLPSSRRRQPRSFPATRPYCRTVQLAWNETPIDRTLAALQCLARDTAYIGHSASLTRCRFLLDREVVDQSFGEWAARWVYKGRFEELEQFFASGRRPLLGARVKPAPDQRKPRTNPFSDRWLLLEHFAGEMPDIRACALVAKTVRDTLLSGYQAIGLGDEIPEVLSGHAADRSPTRAPHLAIIPLPFVGFPHADGHAMGFALIPPRDSVILEDDTFSKVLRSLAPIDEERGRRVLKVMAKRGTAADCAFAIEMSPTFEATRRSLDSSLYLEPAQCFGTVTPIVLDRHLRKKGGAREEEIVLQITAACRNIGLPEPAEVVVGKHSAFEGVPSAYPSAKSPPWMRWRLPPSLVSRQLSHAVIRFDKPIDGPIALGAGRFVGLGLCRALSRV
jgi:CRISPR-associated protein Csb2